jgi:hypothetical protein
VLNSDGGTLTIRGFNTSNGDVIDLSQIVRRVWTRDMKGRFGDSGELLGHPRGLTMLPGGTPTNLWARWYSMASASRSGPVGPQVMCRCCLAGVAGGGVPRAVVGHRAFDGEEAPVMVGDDQEERFAGSALGHGMFLNAPGNLG